MAHIDTQSSSDDETKQDTGRAASDITEALRSSAHDAAEKVSAEASRTAHKAQDSAADEVKGVASALRTAADELRRGSPQERTFSQLADGLADASDAIRDKDMGELVGDLNAFARRNPMVFLGGAALLGFAATRFVKASGSQGTSRHAQGRTPSSGASGYTPAAASRPMSSRPGMPGEESW